MRIVVFQKAEKQENYSIGALISESEIVDLTSLTLKETLTASEINDFYDLQNDFLGKAKSAIENGNLPKIERENVKLCSPIPVPKKIICIGLNYRNHAIESGMEIPKSPIIFSKFSTCVIGANEPILLPNGSDKVDYEAELAFIIGKRANNVSRKDAMDYVLGYTNLNDVSARDFQFADGQWQRGKSCDTFAPIGEFITTKDEIEDPHNLRIQFQLNGETLQDSTTNELIFKIPELIEFLSESISLEPGDIIATGTPPGVGFARKPPIYLKDGDIAKVEIEGLGILSNPVKSSVNNSKILNLNEYV